MRPAKSHPVPEANGSPLGATLAAVLGGALCLAAGCLTTSDRLGLAVRGVPDAARVNTPPMPAGPGPGTMMPQWSVPLSAGGRERVIVESTGSRVRVLSQGRRDTLYAYEDYVYPAELRLSADGSFLYLLASGRTVTSAGSEPVHWIFVYDLQRRRVLGRLEADPAVGTGATR